MGNYDFSGWATRNDLLCGDGRTIRKDAFKDNDGEVVPLVWNHDHKNLDAVLGHALLENRDDGVYAYCTLNDSELAQSARQRIQHGDLRSLSIYANKLKQIGGDVVHGSIKELSLVLAGANPGAYVDFIVSHGDEEGESLEANYDECSIMLYHSDEPANAPKEESKESPKEDEKDMAEKTVADVFNELTEEQKTVVYAMIGQALEENGAVADDEGEENMKHSIFDNNNAQGNYLTHSDEMAILELAKQSSVGDLKEAMRIFAEQNSLQHDAFSDMSVLFPEYELIDPKEPQPIYDDDSWVAGILGGVRKSPKTRIRTLKADARKAEIENELKAKGYKKGDQKTIMDQIKLIGRTHEPQTVYIFDSLHRDDILDIEDFDIVNYEWKIMEHTMRQTLAQAILIGDGRSELDQYKIHEDKIRPIWKDEELYCMHYDVDFAEQKTKLQGTDTSKNFGDDYVYAEAILEAALFSREKYKGSGNLTFYCAPHVINRMLLARDMNGRRIYSNKADLVSALNVKGIETIEQFEGLTREDSTGKTKKMIGLFVNMHDYELGCAKGGQITRFDQFNIRFNQQEMLMETRCSGALVELYSAIALEEEVSNS